MGGGAPAIGAFPASPEPGWKKELKPVDALTIEAKGLLDTISRMMQDWNPDNPNNALEGFVSNDTYNNAVETVKSAKKKGLTKILSRVSQAITVPIAWLGAGGGSSIASGTRLGTQALNLLGITTATPVLGPILPVLSGVVSAAGAWFTGKAVGQGVENFLSGFQDKIVNKLTPLVESRANFENNVNTIMSNLGIVRDLFLKPETFKMYQEQLNAQRLDPNNPNNAIPQWLEYIISGASSLTVDHMIAGVQGAPLPDVVKAQYEVLMAKAQSTVENLRQGLETIFNDPQVQTGSNAASAAGASVGLLGGTAWGMNIGEKIGNAIGGPAGGVVGSVWGGIAGGVGAGLVGHSIFRNIWENVLAFPLFNPYQAHLQHAMAVGNNVTRLSVKAAIPNQDPKKKK